MTSMVKLIPKQVLQRVTLFACLLFVLPLRADVSFSNIFIFGDSMSDTGNLASVIGDFPPAYYNNRMSNGPVGVEVLGEKLGLPTDASLYLVGQNAGTNYAVASAKAGGDAALDLNPQVDAFLSAYGFSAPEDALYVMFIGGNDVRSLREVQDKRSVRASLKNAVASIKQNIDKLISAGARHILVMNSVDMGNLPEAFMANSSLSRKPTLSERTTKITRQFNRILKKGLDDVEDRFDIDIARFNSFRFLNRVIARAKSFGFKYTRESCFVFSTLSFHPDCNFGQNARVFLFFDEKHPTDRGHALIGNAVFELVKDFEWEDKEGEDDEDHD